MTTAEYQAIKPYLLIAEIGSVMRIEFKYIV